MNENREIITETANVIPDIHPSRVSLENDNIIPLIIRRSKISNIIYIVIYKIIN